MPQEQIKQTLDSLHQELAGESPLDPEVRARLQQLAVEIEAALARSGPPELKPEEEETLLDRITGAAAPFEETHPKLAAILGRIADGLSQLGI